jgi:hypothetical protein
MWPARLLYIIWGSLGQRDKPLSEQQEHVTIQDGTGKSISGDDLAARCRGEKTLSPDLRAI